VCNLRLGLFLHHIHQVLYQVVCLLWLLLHFFFELIVTLDQIFFSNSCLLLLIQHLSLKFGNQHLVLKQGFLQFIVISITSINGESSPSIISITSKSCLNLHPPMVMQPFTSLLHNLWQVSSPVCNIFVVGWIAALYSTCSRDMKFLLDPRSSSVFSTYTPSRFTSSVICPRSPHYVFYSILVCNVFTMLLVSSCLITSSILLHTVFSQHVCFQYTTYFIFFSRQRNIPPISLSLRDWLGEEEWCSWLGGLR